MTTLYAKRVRVTCRHDHPAAWYLTIGNRWTQPAFGFRGLAQMVRKLLSTFPPGMVTVEPAGPGAFDICGPVGCVSVHPPGDGHSDDGDAVVENVTM